MPGQLRADQRDASGDDVIDPDLAPGVLAVATGAAWTLVGTVVGSYGPSLGSYRGVAGAPAEEFTVLGQDTRRLMARQLWGARILQAGHRDLPDMITTPAGRSPSFPASHLLTGARSPASCSRARSDSGSASPTVVLAPPASLPPSSPADRACSVPVAGFGEGTPLPPLQPPSGSAGGTRRSTRGAATVSAARHSGCVPRCQNRGVLLRGRRRVRRRDQVDRAAAPRRSPTTPQIATAPPASGRLSASQRPPAPRSGHRRPGSPSKRRMWHGEGTAENGQPDSDGYDLGHEPGTRVKPPRPGPAGFRGGNAQHHDRHRGEYRDHDRSRRSGRAICPGSVPVMNTTIRSPTVAPIIRPDFSAAGSRSWRAGAARRA